MRPPLTSCAPATIRTMGPVPLKRAIQREIETPLVRLILKGEVRDGQALVADVDPQHNELVFAPQSAGAGVR